MPPHLKDSQDNKIRRLLIKKKNVWHEKKIHFSKKNKNQYTLIFYLHKPLYNLDILYFTYIF